MSVNSRSCNHTRARMHPTMALSSLGTPENAIGVLASQRPHMITFFFYFFGIFNKLLLCVCVSVMLVMISMATLLVLPVWSYNFKKSIFGTCIFLLCVFSARYPVCVFHTVILLRSTHTALNASLGVGRK